MSSTPAGCLSCQELAAAGEVAGELRGGGSTWVPAVHARAQQEAVLTFFRSRLTHGGAVRVACCAHGWLVLSSGCCLGSKGSLSLRSCMQRALPPLLSCGCPRDPSEVPSLLVRFGWARHRWGWLASLAALGNAER